MQKITLESLPPALDHLRESKVVHMGIAHILFVGKPCIKDIIHMTSVLIQLASSKTGTQIHIFRSVTSEILFWREQLCIILSGMRKKGCTIFSLQLQSKQLPLPKILVDMTSSATILVSKHWVYFTIVRGGRFLHVVFYVTWSSPQLIQGDCCRIIFIHN